MKCSIRRQLNSNKFGHRNNNIKSRKWRSSKLSNCELDDNGHRHGLSNALLVTSNSYNLSEHYSTSIKILNTQQN